MKKNIQEYHKKNPPPIIEITNIKKSRIEIKGWSGSVINSTKEFRSTLIKWFITSKIIKPITVLINGAITNAQTKVFHEKLLLSPLNLNSLK